MKLIVRPSIVIVFLAVFLLALSLVPPFAQIKKQRQDDGGGGNGETICTGSRDNFWCTSRCVSTVNACCVPCTIIYPDNTATTHAESA